MVDISEIIEALESLGSAERSAKSVTMYPTSMSVIGVTNPDLKIVVRELHETLSGRDRGEFMRLSVALVQSGIIECQMLAWMLLEKAGIVPSITLAELGKLEGKLDNWVSVDTYGTLVYGLLWRLGTVRDDDVLYLLQNGDVWHRRLALVATVALNLKSRGGSGDALRTIMICERCVEDHHDMIVKALSWSLRSLIRWDREAVAHFIGKYQSQLHKRVIREVSHKLDFGTKN
jgi:3-methyladenine DNA glycosylase AlkD